MTELQQLGMQIRYLREAKHFSREALAKKAGLSPRFLAELELGRGNIAFSRLLNLCGALDVPLSTLVAMIPDARQKEAKSSSSYSAILEMLSHRSVDELQEARLILAQRFDNHAKRLALIGLRGAGKTTIGKKVASRLRWKFVELDDHIEKAAGLTLQNIFEVQGEDYYRSLEKQTLLKFLNDPEPAVIAAAGGIVSREDTFDLLRRSCLTFWLKADPEDHWNRVLKQDPRPITNYPNAFAQLQNLLRQREPLYARADFQIDTSKMNLSQSVRQILKDVQDYFPARRIANFS